MQIFTQFSPELESLWQHAYKESIRPWPFYLYDWHKTWYEHLGATTRLLVYAGKDPAVIVPLTVTGDTVSFTGGGEIADYLDAIGSREIKDDAWKFVIDDLPKHGVASLKLRNIPADSRSIPFFRNLPGATVTEEDSTPILMLPESFDAYQSALDRKKRHELRRKMRRFEKVNPDIAFRVLEGPDISIPRLLELMKLDPQKQDFLSVQMESFFLQLPHISGLKLVQFCLGNHTDPAANTLAFAYNDALLLYNSGYNPDIDGAGFYVKTKSIEWAIENGYRTYNFLQGKERYKYELGGQDFPVYRIDMPLSA